MTISAQQQQLANEFAKTYGAPPLRVKRGLLADERPNLYGIINSGSLRDFLAVLYQLGFLTNLLNINRRYLKEINDYLSSPPREHALHVAAQHGNLEIVVWLSQQLGCDQIDGYGNTPGVYAAERGHLDTLVALLKHKKLTKIDPLSGEITIAEADIDKVNTYLTCRGNDCHSIVNATIKGHIDVVRWLINNTNLNELRWVKQSLGYIAACTGNLSTLVLLLRNKGFLDGSNNIIEKYRQAANLYLTIERHQYHVIHNAAFSGHIDVVTFLVSNFGCKQRDCHRRSPGYMAVNGGKLDILKLFFSKLEFLDEKGDVRAENVSEAVQYLTGSNNKHAIYESLNSSMQYQDYPDKTHTALWLYQQLGEHLPHYNGLSPHAYILVHEQLNLFKKTIRMAGYTDTLGCFLGSAEDASKVLVHDWVSNARTFDLRVPGKQTLLYLANIGIPLTSIRQQFVRMTHSQMNPDTHQRFSLTPVDSYNEIEADFSPLLEDSCEATMPPFLQLPARLETQSVLDILIDKNAGTVLNQMLIRGDTMPKPLIQLNELAAPHTYSESQKQLLVNAWSIYYAQRIYHALQQDTIDKTLLNKHFAGLINTQIHWPCIECAKYLPALKNLLLAIKELLEAKDLYQAYVLPWVEAAWPTLQTMASELEPEALIVHEAAAADVEHPTQHTEPNHTKSDSLIETLLSQSYIMYRPLPGIKPDTHTHLISLVAGDAYHKLMIERDTDSPKEAHQGEGGSEQEKGQPIFAQKLTAVARHLGILVVKSLLNSIKELSAKFSHSSTGCRPSLADIRIKHLPPAIHFSLTCTHNELVSQSSVLTGTKKVFDHTNLDDIQMLDNAANAFVFPPEANCAEVRLRVAPN